VFLVNLQCTAFHSPSDFLAHIQTEWALSQSTSILFVILDWDILACCGLREADFRCDDRRFISGLILKMSRFITSDSHIKKRKKQVLYPLQNYTANWLSFKLFSFTFIFLELFLHSIFPIKFTVSDALPFVANIQIFRKEIPRNEEWT